MTEARGDVLPPVEPKIRASELARRLQEFAGATAGVKDRLLPELVIFALENFDIDVASEMVDPEFQKQLDAAVDKTFHTPLVESELTGTITENPWKGGHSMVVLGKDGRILGARFIQAEQLKEYGDTTPYALAKALCEAYLDEVGKPGGLDNFENLKHITRDRGEGVPKLNFYEHIFTGSEAGPVTLGDRTVYIGGSGCVAKDEYIQDLLKLPSLSTPGTETLSGVADSAFCKVTRHYLENPNAPAAPMPEPTVLQEVRKNN